MSATFTPDDLLRLPDEGIGYELVGGRLREQQKTFLTRYVAGNVLAAVSSAVQRTGWVVTSGVGFRCFPADPDRVRRADVAFHTASRLSTDQAKDAGHLTVVPDLVVEVVSPNDLADDVERKRVEWLAAGAALVWVIHPGTQTVPAYRADGTSALFRSADTLTADPVLPDFRVPVADLFHLPAAGPN